LPGAERRLKDRLGNTPSDYNVDEGVSKREFERNGGFRLRERERGKK
jgi:hypothetical protein